MLFQRIYKRISELLDVLIATPANGDVLTYESASSKWKNKPASGAAGAALTANNLSDLASATTARTNLGLGSIATQAASAVAITGGTVAGLSSLTVSGTTTFLDSVTISSGDLECTTGNFSLAQTNINLDGSATFGEHISFGVDGSARFGGAITTNQIYNATDNITINTSDGSGDINLNSGGNINLSSNLVNLPWITANTGIGLRIDTNEKTLSFFGAEGYGGKGDGTSNAYMSYMTDVPMVTLSDAIAAIAQLQTILKTYGIASDVSS